ncbi:MAG: TonB-dependent receptor, partial [Mangrovibacterium sp.]|nr:TonB-dependent receptor [Mangrovibacterium sp.]
DKPHNLNALANVKLLRRLIFSASLNYSTGRPITYPVAQYKLGDQVFLHYSRYNQYRIPDYFRTDLSVTIEGNLKSNKLIHGTLTFSLYNLTGRKNAYSVYFRSEGSKVEAYKLSIFGTAIPTVTYNFRF